MGEEAKQEASSNKEEGKAEEEKKEEKAAEAAEEKKEEEAKPPSPLVLYIDLHCLGCSKKIERTILKIKGAGVEGVEMDMLQNQVSIKGAIADPQALCALIEKKTKRRVKIVSPLPEAAEGQPIPPVVATSQVSDLTTVELNVNMHCEACAQQLKRMILKMKGVTTAETELSSGKVRVTGTLDANRLVDYVYRRTKKQAKVVPQPEPAEKPKEEEKPPAAAQKEDKPPANDDQEKKPEEATADDQKPSGEADDKKEGGTEDPEIKKEEGMVAELQNVHKMMYYYDYQQQPLHFIERVPPPQLFSDENPNACCIT